MTKIEDYMEKAAASLAAATSASTERERSFHHRAHCIWRRLVADAEFRPEQSRGFGQGSGKKTVTRRGSFDAKIAECMAQFREVETRSSERTQRLGIEPRSPGRAVPKPIDEGQSLSTTMKRKT